MLRALAFLPLAVLAAGCLATTPSPDRFDGWEETAGAGVLVAARAGGLEATAGHPARFDVRVGATGLLIEVEDRDAPASFTLEGPAGATWGAYGSLALHRPAAGSYAIVLDYDDAAVRTFRARVTY